ncbi:MAG: MBL fold metallo-hydrolase [Deltaproteobacteria bacterium]|nr:MBL fold metallo-hydrolase [Deltaproteobacteria bacterium]
MTIPQKITENVTILGTYEFNQYLIKGDDGYIIIEGGISAQTEKLKDQIKNLGVNFHDIHTLVVLHAHFDHIMTFPYIMHEFPWIKLAIPKKAENILKNPRIISKILISDKKVSFNAKEKGLIKDLPQYFDFKDLPFDILLTENDTLFLDEKERIRFLDVPGHSPDGMAAFMENGKVLFVSDAAGVLFDNHPYKPNYFFNMGHYLNSLSKLKDLDAEFLCFGHNGFLKGKERIRVFFDNAILKTKEFSQVILDELKAGRSEDEIASVLTKKFSVGFLKLFPMQDNLRLWKIMVQRSKEYSF